ncbi:CheY-P phosphatase CheX [Fundidesulfovibrio magnetotacticus]|uniref:CheY-P phosphatase CheX n=1 Tax=Fundidesulfovibrio magnetotacticus TaxID=2730080 RepID=A0A6V8LPM2_9BACT|nr:chemotaxis protein CheX [Fundidesulfovibrio magnetotacticus]GFK92940.1 CheY-P phosphatase CheX [Fundidesulfovibrio magnetotacticus]
MNATDAEIAKPFVQATKHVLTTMAMIEPAPGKPYAKKNNTAAGDVSAVVGLTGDKNGSISISFTKKCAVAIVKNMLGDDIQDIVQDTKDAVGEITNMISGQARAGLAQMGLAMQASTPTIIFGDNHSISHVTSGSVVAIPFTTPNGDFTVEFCFE